MSNAPSNLDPLHNQGAGGSNQMAAILANGSQPNQPQNAAFRNRTGVNDSENVDPGANQLAAILANGAANGAVDGVVPGNAGNGPGGQASKSRRAGQAIGALTTATLGANVAINGFTNRILRANDRLAEWNGEIAAAVALAQAQQIERDIYQGEGMATQYARLDEANQEYRNMMTEVTTPLQAAGMDLLAGLAEYRNMMLSNIMPALTRGAEEVKELARIMSFGLIDDTNSAPGARAFLSDLSDGKFDGIGTSYMNPGNRPLMSDADRRRIFGP